jgi:hypothetical protein
MASVVLLSALSAVFACSGAGPRTPDAPTGDGDTGLVLDPDDRILDTDLVLDLEGLSGRALITAGPSDFIELSVGGLSSIRVTDALGVDVPAEATEGVLRLPGRRDAETTYVFEYDFAPRASGTHAGWVPDSGYTLLWPYFCENLFPCDPSPRDGTRFSLRVEGVPSGQMAIYPPRIATPAPSYMLAVAVGEYRFEHLGTTTGGTDVGVYYFPGDEVSAHEGVDALVQVIDFYERTYGPYLFGDEIASVAVSWGTAGLGGMEHHPFFHVARPSMASPVVQAHEAAHGWFGNGVRIRCWEDFVLSEGVATYLAGRALASVLGPTAEAEVWDGYAADLGNAVSRGDTEAWPTGCGEIDILTHPVWSSIPYAKGAFFLRAVEREVGAEALDTVLARLYQRHGGADAASMSDLIAAIEGETGFDTSALTATWLRGLGVPPLP